MIDKKIFWICSLSIGLIASPVVSAQNKNNNNTTPTSINVINEAKWEYLVVSYGKTVFGSPEKTLAYRSIGLSATAQEANEIQQSLDVLGRFGWEVITVVGAIGGDQQIVMKRRYDKNRVASEGLSILRGRELYLNDLIDILERSRKTREEQEAAAAVRNQSRLVDLDAKESEDRRQQLTSELGEKIKLILVSIPVVKNPIVSARAFDSSGKYNYVDIKLDVTELMLKDGGNYRASEVKNWLGTTPIPALRSTLDYGSSSIDITVSATINFNGKTEKVGEQKIRWSGIKQRWD